MNKTHKKIAVSLKAKFQLGKGDITDNFVKQIIDFINKNEYCKIHILKTSLYDTTDLQELFEQYGIETVHKIGNTITLYKEKEEK